MGGELELKEAVYRVDQPAWMVGRWWCDGATCVDVDDVKRASTLNLLIGLAVYVCELL